MTLARNLIICCYLVFNLQNAFCQELPLYPSESSAGRPDSLQMMVGADGKAKDGDEGLVESIMNKAIETDQDGTIIGGEFIEKEKQARDLLTNQLPDETDPTSPKDYIPHKYDRGSNDVSDNEQFDYHNIVRMINPSPGSLSPESCLDYQIIGTCTKILPGVGPIDVPYIKYHGPPQKVENVDQPYKTGYVSKNDIATVMNQFDATDYQNVFAEIADLETSYNETVWRLKASQRGINASAPENNPNRDNNIKDIIKEVQSKYDHIKRFRNYDNVGSGYVYNEYHLMPTGIDLWQGEAYYLGKADIMAQLAILILEIIQALYPQFPPGPNEPFVHNSKEPKAFFSEMPENLLKSRVSFSAFDNQIFKDPMIGVFMLMKSYYPEVCQYFNTNYQWKNFTLDGMANVKEERRINFDPKTTSDSPGKRDSFYGTPEDMLKGFLDPSQTGIIRNGGFENICQGINQGSWLPFFNTVNTIYHTTAAAIGTVRGINAGYGTNPEKNYPYTYDNEGRQPAVNIAGDVSPEHDGDKVQWLRNAYMDGDEVAQAGDKKPCRSVEKWVQKYGKANLKHYSDKIGDNSNPSGMQEFEGGNWHVVAHWRYWRGCLDPFPTVGAPPFPPPNLPEQKD